MRKIVLAAVDFAPAEPPSAAATAPLKYSKRKVGPHLCVLADFPKFSVFSFSYYSNAAFHVQRRKNSHRMQSKGAKVGDLALSGWLEVVTLMCSPLTVFIKSYLEFTHKVILERGGNIWNSLKRLSPKDFHLLANLFLFVKTFIRNLFEKPAKSTIVLVNCHPVISVFGLSEP